MKRLAALTVTAALALSGCSLGERARHAEQLVSSAGRAVEARTAVGSMTVQLSSRPIGGNPDGAPVAGPALAANLTPPPVADVAVALDFDRASASIGVPGPDGSVEPIIVLDGTRVYVRRGSTTGISSRRWVVLDLARIEKISPPDASEVADRTGVLLLAFPGPLHLVELVAGSLTGSVRSTGPNAFAANLSREKADRELHLKDKAIEHRSSVLSLVAVLDEVHPAEITLDDHGRPHMLDVRLYPRLRSDLEVELRVRTELAYQPATVEIPSDDDTLVLETEGQLIGEAVALGRALANGGIGAGGGESG